MSAAAGDVATVEAFDLSNRPCTVFIGQRLDRDSTACGATGCCRWGGTRI